MHYSMAVVCAIVGLGVPLAAAAQPSKPADTERGDKVMAEYLRAETARLTQDCLDEVTTLEDWTSRRDEYRQQLLEMLGLDPLPEKTDLKPVVTGKVEHDEFTVEKLHFQSRPGLYVTGSLYVPKNLKGPAPTTNRRITVEGSRFGNKPQPAV